jgi:hypothetical protein
MENQQYEFDQSQNELILDLANKMRFVAYLSVAVGTISFIGGLIPPLDIANLIQGTIMIILGIWTTKAASSFKKIVDTRDNDIVNLMGALGELRKLYGLQYWLFIIALTFIALAIVFGIIIAIVAN